MFLLAAPAAGAEKAQEIDGELLAACARYQKLEALHRRLSLAADGDTPAHKAAEADLDAMTEEYREGIDLMAALPARTPEGLQAKAGAIVVFHGGANDYGQDYPHERLEWSLFMDVAGRAGA